MNKKSHVYMVIYLQYDYLYINKLTRVGTGNYYMYTKLFYFK